MSPNEITSQIVDAACRIHTQVGPGRNEKNMRAEAQRAEEGKPIPYPLKTSSNRQHRPATAKA